MRYLRIIIPFAILLTGLYYAWHLRWVSEDAYISFRYARNLIEGHGLVFNPGEKVEGYTNFLWTLFLAAGLAVKLTPEMISFTLGLFCSALTLTGLLVLHRFLFREKAVLPAAVLALALNYTWASFSTSGLETSALGLWMTGIYLLLFLWTSHRKKLQNNGLFPVYIGCVLALAMMTRPDAALMFPCIVLFVVLQRPKRREALAVLAAISLSLLFLYLPYFLWRYSYYGYFFPNTYYAKSANLANYGQGLIYLWEFLHRYFLWAFLPPALFTAFRAVRRRSCDPIFVTMTAFCLIYTFYAVRVGGDFMEGRFFVPILPFVYLLVERSIRQLSRSRLIVGVILTILLVSTASDRQLIAPRKITNGITDERSWAPVFALWYAEGLAFGRHLPAGTVIATDAVGAFGYGSGLPIIDTLGLTDTTVAHQPLSARSRPGHEKSASPGYLKRRSTALYRDGVNMYRFDRQPDFEMAGNRYFLVSADSTVVRGFHRAVAELQMPGESSR